MFHSFLRRLLGRCRLNRSQPLRRRPRPVLSVEALEQRDVPTTTVFLDFGSSFPNGQLTVGGQTLMSLNQSVINQGLLNQGLDYNGDGVADQADTALLEKSVVDIVKRTLEPFNLNVVVTSAVTLTDIQSTLNTASHDAYILVAGNAPPGLLAYGWAPLDPGNWNDDIGYVYADDIITKFGAASAATALARVAAHEAAHTFGVGHYDGTSALSRGDVMGAPEEKADARRFDVVATFMRYNASWGDPDPGAYFNVWPYGPDNHSYADMVAAVGLAPDAPG